MMLLHGSQVLSPRAKPISEGTISVVISSMDWILRSNPYPLQFLKADPYPMDLTTAKSIIAGYIAG
jgi:hypothetical protein